MHPYCTLPHSYKHGLNDTCSQTFRARKTARREQPALWVHLVKDALIGTESSLTSRFDPLLATFVRFSPPLLSRGDGVFSRSLSGATLHISTVASRALLHPQLSPPTSYYQMTFNPSATRRLRSVLHLSATDAPPNRSHAIKVKTLSIFHRQVGIIE